MVLPPAIAASSDQPAPRQTLPTGGSDANTSNADAQAGRRVFLRIGGGAPGSNRVIYHQMTPVLHPDDVLSTASMRLQLQQLDHTLRNHELHLLAMQTARDNLDVENLDQIHFSDLQIQSIETRIRQIVVLRSAVAQRLVAAEAELAQQESSQAQAPPSVAAPTETPHWQTTTVELQELSSPQPQPVSIAGGSATIAGGSDTVQPQPQQQRATLHGTISRNDSAREHAIEIPVGVNNLRMHVNRTGHQIVTTPNSIGQQVQIAIPHVRLAPLETLQLPFERRSSDEDDASEEQRRFQCAICFEYMQDPASCGSCSTRYCAPCIVRVARTPNRNKCPTCRTEITPEGIKRDGKLQMEIRQAARIRCACEGCDAILPLDKVQSHETQCKYVPMRCRYAPFGCGWKGRRMDVPHHETVCDLAKVSNLVEQFRQSRADHQHIIGHIQQRLSGTTDMMEVHHRLLARLQPHPTNLFDLANIVYTATCTPAMLLFNRDVWRMFLSADQGRAAVCNFLYLLPSFVLIARCAGMGYRTFLFVGETTSIDDYLREMEKVLLSVTVVLTGVLIGLCFFLDHASCTAFSNYNIRGWERKFLHDLVSLSFCVLFFMAVEFDGAFTKAGIVWMMVCTSTCFFPSLVMTILSRSSGIVDITTEKILSSGRAAEVVIFGVRYGLLANFLGVLPTLDAFCLLQLFQGKFSQISTWNLTMTDDGILSQVPNDVRMFYAGTRLAVKALEFVGDKRSPVDTILGLMLLPLVNKVVYQLTLLGVEIGSKMIGRALHTQGQLVVNPMNISSVYDGMGITSFAVWTMLLGGIALSF
jgi:hypothetical protein